jgi:hypothetical protein
MGKVIRNVNLLDLTEATEENFTDVTAIENVNLMLYSKQSAKFLAGIKLVNVNASTEIPEACSRVQVVNGEFKIGKGFESSSGELIFYLVNGNVIVEPGVLSETIEKAVGGLFVNGNLYCPESLSGVLQTKIQSHNGNMVTYMDDADVLVKEVVLDNHYLQSLQPGTKLVVMGTTRIIDSLDITLLEERLGKLACLGNLLIREEYAEAISRKMQVAARRELKLIPTAAIFVDKDLQIDAASITRYQAAKLYVTGTLTIGEDVSTASLEAAITQIHAGKIICKKELKAAVVQRCDDDSVSEVLDYSGRLVRVEGEYTLTDSELEYTKGELTLVVHGMLTIAADVDPATLYEKIAFIDNYGVIHGSVAQCGVIQVKLRKNEGHIGQPEEEQAIVEVEEEAESDDSYIANINFLKL